MTRYALIGLALFLVGCGATVSTTNRLAVGEGGVPYTLPTGLVPIIVFADQEGVGITIEPASMAVDSRVGTLIARFRLNPFNNEDIKVEVKSDTGFLSTTTSDSKAQILAIAAEAAAANERLSFQNAQASFLQQRVVVLQDAFDPLSPADVTRINKGLQHAVRHAARAFANATGSQSLQGQLHLQVAMPDGSDAFIGRINAPLTQSTLADCSIGICARTMTSRVIRIVHDGTSFGSKLVNVPARELVPVPVSSRLFANQKTSITVQNGILTGTQVVRDSEALGIIKIPGQILGGLVSGFTQAVNDEKTLSAKEIEQIEAQEKLETARRETVQLQNDTAVENGSLYLSQTLTVYPFSNALQSAIRRQVDAANARTAADLKAIAEGTDGTAPPTDSGDLLTTPAETNGESSG